MTMKSSGMEPHSSMSLPTLGQSLNFKSQVPRLPLNRDNNRTCLTEFWRLLNQISPIANIKHGLPWWLSGKESACQCRRCGFNPWVRRIPWRRKWQPTLVFLPGKSHRQRNLVGYTVHGVQKVRCDLVTKQQQQEIANVTIPGRQKLSNKYAIYLNLSIYLSVYLPNPHH